MGVHGIDSGIRMVSWEERGEIAIGRHACDWCGTLTPIPSDSVVISFIRDHPHASTMWPFDRAGGGMCWHPPGWREGDPELCPACATRHDAAIDAARAEVRRNKK